MRRFFIFEKASLCPKIWQAFAKEKSVPENMYQKKASGHKTMSMFIRYDLVDEEDLKRMKWVDSESESNNEDFGAKISA